MKMIHSKKLILLALTFAFLPLAVMAQQQNPFKNITETTNGFVGIGTQNPDQLLTVKGTIHTQEVLVDLDGAVAPDYVFEKYFTGTSLLNPDYEFTDLYALEDFVKEYHHLPKVPSAKTMETGGVSMKELNLLLLEKIEELTLHTIAQQKQIDVLTQKIEALENE